MIRKFNAEDEGKLITTPDGDVLGSVARVHGGDAYVEPVPGLLDGCGSWLTGTWTECESFPLDPRTVAVIRDDRIVLDDLTPRSVSGLAVGSK